MKRIVISLAGASLLAAPVHSVSAQAWIGQMVGDMMAQQAAAEARHRCYMGDPMEPAEVEEARAPTNTTMQAYFTAMQSGTGSAADHFALDKKTRWTLGGTSLGETALGTASDPFASAGAVIDVEPQTYVRSGQGALTHADWQVRDAQGELIGTYSGYFVRKLGDYKLRTLTLTPASEYVEPVVQFCDEPGDVMPYRLDYTERWKASWEKSVAKAETKLAGHQAKLTLRRPSSRKSQTVRLVKPAWTKRKSASPSGKRSSQSVRKS